MSMEDNKAIIRRFYDEVINRRHLAVLDEIIAPDFERFKTEGIDCASNCEVFKHILAFVLRTSLIASRPFTPGTLKRMSW